MVMKMSAKNKSSFQSSQNMPLTLPPVTASDMASNLEKAATILLASRLLDNEGYSILAQQVAIMKRHKSSVSWTYSVDPDRPISFAETVDKNGSPVFPTISCDIVVDQTKPDKLPFKTLDVALLVVGQNKQKICRWHVDLANRLPSSQSASTTFQDGPLTHLQYGGHIRHGNRHNDHPLKVPRWLFPPLDLILLCEVVASNFFPNVWEDTLQQNPTWNEVVSTSQRLCYAAFINKLHSTLAVSNRSILQHMCASIWGQEAHA
ncbi:hypothetical protein GAY31_22670 [Azospirillum brasilense]|nr:hypothetical protein [Azospirillum brasilense]